MAFLKLRKQDFAGAKSWLDRISNPETALVRKQQGYYNYLNGIMMSQTNLIQAEKYFKKAIELGLSMDMDLAVAKLNLAGVAMSRRRKLEATNLIAEVKKLDKQNMLADQVKSLDWREREAAFGCTLPPDFLQRILDRARLLLAD